MDTVTHTFIGVCMGEAILGKQLGKKAMLIGAIANNFPDIDVAAGVWATETSSLLIHRGLTHSIVLNIIFTFLLAIIFKRIFRMEAVSFRQWLLLMGSGLFCHIFIDAFTAYGTGWFEPFNHTRICFNTIFILDPLFTLPVLIAGLVLVFLKRDSLKRKSYWKAGLLLPLFYLVFTVINKIYVNNVVKANLEAKGIKHLGYLTTPTPLNNFLWYIVVKERTKFSIGYFSLFDKSKNLSFESIQKNDSLLTFPGDSMRVNDLIQFSQGYYSVNSQNDTILFSDLRFGENGGWYKKNAGFVFNFKLTENYGNRTALQKGRLEVFDENSMRQLTKRIKGN